MTTLLRPYQQDAINDLREGFRQGNDKQILSASTGSGKSVIMRDMVRSAFEKGSRVIFICERRNLVDQFSEHLDAEGIPHGVIMAGHRRWTPDAPVQIASAQTLERMETWPSFDICFIDEVHACMRKSIVQMLETRRDMKVIGATATPFHPLLPKHFLSVVSAPPMAKLVEMGNLVPFRVFAAHEIDTDGVRVIAGEWQKDELEKRGRQVVGDIVVDYLRLSSEVFGRRSKAICFSCGIAHGAELVDAFLAAGINAVQLASGVDEDFKADVLRDFAKPDSGIDILISVDMLSRGFDQTDIEHVILARPLKKSFSQHVQMIGRGARSHEGKNLCVVQDHCNNWLRFADQWDDFFHNGVKTLAESPDQHSKKEPSRTEKDAAKCPKCSALWSSGSEICLHCGHVRQRRSNVSILPGTMREITASSKKAEFSSDYKREFYHAMIGHLRATGKNENRAFYLYREKFGADPVWKKEAGPITLDAIRWIQRANIAFARRRAA
jgi:DNA repair protein RadD